MARQRYTTTSPTFSNDFMYNAPWELAMNALQFNEKQVTNIHDQATLFGGATDSINYLEADRANVEAERAKINTEVDDITAQLKEDPTQWRRLAPKIKSVGANLQTNLKTGNLSKIQGSYNAYQSFQKQYEDLAKKDPQTVQRVSAKYLADWKEKNPNGSLNSIFQGGPIHGKVSLMDEKFQKIFKEIKADKSTTIQGLYKIDNKWVSEKEVEQIALSMAMSDPDMVNYVRQQQWLGDESYTSPLYSYKDAVTGKELTPQEAQSIQENFSKRAAEIQNILSDPNKKAKLTPAELQQMQEDMTQRVVSSLNGNNAIAQQVNLMGNVFSFREQEVKGDEVGMLKVREAGSDRRTSMTINAANARQDKALADAAKARAEGREHDLNMVEHKAKFATTKGKGGKSTTPTIQDSITSGGTAYYPGEGNPLSVEAKFLNQGGGTTFQKLVASSKINTVADAAMTSTLASKEVPKSKEVIDYVTFLNHAVKAKNPEVLSLIENKDSDALRELFLNKTVDSRNALVKPVESQQNYLGISRDVDLARHEGNTNLRNQAQERQRQFDVIAKASSTFINDYNSRAEKLSTPIAQSEFYGVNRKSPEILKQQNEINLNKTSYKFYDPATNKEVPASSISDINLTGIGAPNGSSPVSFNVSDGSKSYVAVPEVGRGQQDLSHIVSNVSKMINPKELPNANLDFGMDGKIANLASTFRRLTEVSDVTQSVDVPVSNSKTPIKLVREVRGNKINFKVHYPGKSPMDYTMDYNERNMSDINSMSAYVRLLDYFSKHNNLDYQLN